MNKETLEHYGWLIIAIILLTFLLAFASPLSAWTIRGIGQTVKDAQGASGVCEHTNTVVTEEWQPYNETQHEKVKITTCTSCGKVTQTLHTGTYANHHWDANYICTDCGYQHIHNYNQVTSTTYEEIAGNSLYHYRHTTKRCVCGATIVLTELELHEYGGDNVCDLCGYERHEIVTITDEPHQIGTLTYNKTTQQPTLENYDITSPGYVYRDGVPTGVTQATNAGSYTMTFTLQDGFVWSSTGTKTLNVTWTIGKATPTIANLPEAIVLSASQPDYAFTMKMKYMDADVPGNIVYSLSNTTYAQLKDDNADSYYDKVSAKTPITPGTATLSLTCNPTDTENYNSVSGTTAVVVTNSSKAVPSISANLSNPVEVAVGLNIEVTLTTPTDVEFNSAISFNSTYVTAKWKNNNPSEKTLVITGVKATGETSIDLSTIATAQYLSGTYTVRVTVVKRDIAIEVSISNFGSEVSSRVYATQTKESAYWFVDPSTGATIPASQVSSASSMTISSANTTYVTASINYITAKFSVTGVKATTSTINITLFLPESEAFTSATKVVKVTQVYKMNPTATLIYQSSMYYDDSQYIIIYSNSNGGISSSTTKTKSSSSNVKINWSGSNDLTGTLVSVGTYAGKYRYSLGVLGNSAGGSSTITINIQETDIYTEANFTATIAVNKKVIKFMTYDNPLTLAWKSETSCNNIQTFYDESGYRIYIPTCYVTSSSSDLSVQDQVPFAGANYRVINVSVATSAISKYKGKTSATTGLTVTVNFTTSTLNNYDIQLFTGMDANDEPIWSNVSSISFGVKIPPYSCAHSNYAVSRTQIVSDDIWDTNGWTYVSSTPQHAVYRYCIDCGEKLYSGYAHDKENCSPYHTLESDYYKWSCPGCGNFLKTKGVYCGSHCGYWFSMTYSCTNSSCPFHIAENDANIDGIHFGCAYAGGNNNTDGHYPQEMRDDPAITIAECLNDDFEFVKSLAGI